ncbi:TIGR02221 family CRISPR-associated protein [Candidatus Acidulodesulfobacterium sp. H_13]|uniref:TIGR02221 family CRISPR-associated protein n=1 Tax=Candidatus Acidulodesulfobacterium sp. H_13 TaxID=3395470 RepID=UPI003AF67B0D
MSKILITSIGTGKKEDGGYKTAKYKIDDKLYEESIIAKALYNHVHFDKIFMLGTSRSMWDAVYLAFGGKDENAWLELEGKQDAGGITEGDLSPITALWEEDFKMAGSKTFVVHYGIDDSQLWDNFETYIKIAEYIEDGDKVYLDITHSFRSLSLMSYIMLDLVKSMRQKEFTVEAIFYGMFEYIYEPSNVENITPVVNLKILFEINEWIKAISAFKNYGRAELIAENFNKQFGKKDEKTKYFSRFSENISIANLAAIKAYVDRVKDKLSLFDGTGFPIIKLVSKDLIDFTKRMDKRCLSDFQLEVATWFYENKNYAISYIALTESVVSKICEMEGIGIESESDRKKAKNCLHSKAEYESLEKKYITPNKVRNNVAHQLSDRRDNIISDINNLKNSIDDIKKEFMMLDNKN